MCWWKRKSLECFLSETASDRISVEKIYKKIHVIVIALHLSQTICWPILYSLWFKAQKINFSWGTIFFSLLYSKGDYFEAKISYQYTYCIFSFAKPSLLYVVSQQFKKFYNVLYFRSQHLECHLKYRILKISSLDLSQKVEKR